MSHNFSRRLLARALWSMCILLGFGVVSSWAQITQGSISVSVGDPSGALLSDADLMLQDLATNVTRTATTGSGGAYTFAGLPTGTYRLTVTKQGFATQVFQSVTVSATRVTDINVALKVGATSEKVEVSAEEVPVLETEANAITATIDMKQVEDLPLVGRDISALSQLVVGYAGGTWNGLPYMATGNNVDGVVGTTQRMKFAGAAQPLVQARVENMEEMTVQTDQLNVNTGYGISDMQVNFVTRRGSNSFHGRVYEDFRNAALNANTWVNNATGLPKASFIRNEFGGSLGGAIIKDKLFFFGTFAMAKQPSGATNSNTVMSPLAQTGVFTFTAIPPSGPPVTERVNLLTDIAAGASGQPACCGLPTTVNPAVAGIFSNISSSLSAGAVTPNSDANLVDVHWTYPTPLTQYFPTARVDYNMRDNLRWFLSWNMTKSSQTNGDIPPLPGSYYSKFGGTNNFKYFTLALGNDWTISKTILNSFRAGYLYNSATYGYDLTPAWLTQPSISFAYGASGVELNNLPVGTYYPLFNASDNVTWQKAKHTVSFGFSFFREQDHYYNSPAGFPFITMGIDSADPAGTVFTNYFAQHYTVPDPNNNNQLVPEYSQSDLTHAENMYATLAGRINSVNPGGAGFPLDPKTRQYSTSVGGYFLDELQHGTGLFIQDAWRAKPHLTINAGLRWDFVSPSKDLTVGYHSADNVGIWGPSGVGNIFNPGSLTSDPNGLNPVYKARASVYDGWYVTPQPQLGISWNPTKTEGLMGKLFAGNSTVIRAGFGLRRMTEPYQFFWNSASNEGYAFYQSFRLTPEVPGSNLPPGGFNAGSYALGNPQPVPYYVSPATYQAVIPESQETFVGYWSGVNGLNQHIHQPYVMSWNFGIQRALGSSNVIEIRYMGNRSVHQWIVENPNEVNIFENGFLNEFKLAQQNLAVCNAVPTCKANVSFAYNPNLAGSVPLPIMTAAAGGDASFFTNNVSSVANGAAGALASVIAGSATYLCNLIGSANFSPCAINGVANPGSGYPINFFQANPYNAGKATGFQTDPGYGTYHSLQVDFRQKPWHGMQFDVNYAWSHALGVQPNNSWTGAFNLFTMRNLRDSYGPTGFDYRHVIHGNGTYDLPFGRGRKFASSSGVADKIIGGWSVGTIVNWQTGGPYQLLGGFNTVNGPTNTPVGDVYGDGGVVLNGVSLSDLQASKVHRVAGAPYSLTINPKYFNFDQSTGLPTGVNQAYIAPNKTPGVFGGHPWLYGPHTFSQDLAITKTFAIHENVRFIFQSEFINVWNHPVWANPA
ncbi:MAG TPA: carboxypeptidase regulatory-like domain-containing protein, partial [Candidatus Sulfotelmatobacter sp.]|nr:carboxypeptidase regulatory-like domain-containing protein [Candidatus Sulfotelmatobacter sp.]